MCGFVGVVARQDRRVGLSDAQLVRMRDTMTSRGPDGAGMLRRGSVALGHRRLAIRDLDGGAQPWLSDDGQAALVYNGELYNDQALRRELQRAGHRFRDRCDTAVVLAAYRQWGPAALRRLRGMFACAIYDFRDHSLLLARDRFGIKPLFLSEIDGQLVFASSMAAILAHPRFSKHPNLPALSHFLTTLRLSLGRETVYAGIWQLLPGEMLQYRDGQVAISRYWDFPNEEDGQIDLREAVQELQRQLTEATTLRLVSDVPVGVLLSGGVDSNVLACLLRGQQPSSRLIAECGGGDLPDAEDFRHARDCAATLGLEYGEVRVSAENYRESWIELVERSRSPLSTPSDVIIYELARHLKRSVGVVLGGEGADELLCGYAVQHWSGRDFESSRRLASGGWIHGTAAARRFLHGLQGQYGRDSFDSETDHYLALNSLIPPAAKSRLWQPWAWRQAEEDRRMWSWYDRMFRELDGLGPLRKSARLLHQVNLESLLARLDMATMQASLEARVPYTDHVLVEQMYRLPHRFKIDVAASETAPYLPSAQLEARGTLRSKRVLRLLADRLLPPALARRRKASFPTPVQHWLAGPWQEWAANRLRTSPFARELFQLDVLSELAGNVTQAGMWLWPLLNLTLWGDREFSGRS